MKTTNVQPNNFFLLLFFFVTKLVLLLNGNLEIVSILKHFISVSFVYDLSCFSVGSPFVNIMKNEKAVWSVCVRTSIPAIESKSSRRTNGSLYADNFSLKRCARDKTTMH